MTAFTRANAQLWATRAAPAWASTLRSWPGVRSRANRYAWIVFTPGPARRLRPRVGHGSPRHDGRTAGHTATSGSPSRRGPGRHRPRPGRPPAAGDLARTGPPRHIR